ncbi:MAG: hypothetical protein FWC43_05165 [Planctomycetaceae bacterium]|nr:hypothetical protein [Planctomycetaceae bacterium]
MKTKLPILIALYLLFLFAGLVQQVAAKEPVFTCEAAADWTAVLDRTEGWIAGDGIFSFGLDGEAWKTDENSKTFFIFSDSFFGGVNPDKSYKPGSVMINHCMAVLEGGKPDPEKIRFLHGTAADGRPKNLFDRNYWHGDAIILDSVLYTTGTVVDPATWEMEGPWMIKVPIRDEMPDFSRTETKRVELFHKDGDYQVLFGIGICRQGDISYVYGFRDKKGAPFFQRQLVVAKAPCGSFDNVSTWRFWTGDRWSEKIADTNRDEAVLASGMSNELSVTKMKGGRLDGKFVLVYTEGCVGPNLNFAVADSPYDKFSKPTTFYVCPEPEMYDAQIKKDCGPKASVITYNAKAHPQLSRPGELVVSYNLNAWGLKEGIIFAEKTYYFPRFVRLKL